MTSYTDSFGNQLTYTYDAAGQMTGLTLPGGKTVSYSYDHLHRLSKVSDWQGNFAFYSYDNAGYPVSLSVSGGPVTIYQYDGARNLRAIVSTGPDGTPVAGYRYNVDSNGNRTDGERARAQHIHLHLTAFATWLMTPPIIRYRAATVKVTSTIRAAI